MTFGYRSLIPLFECDGMLCSEICVHVLCNVATSSLHYVNLMQIFLEHVWCPQWRKRALRTVDQQIPS